MNFFKTKLQEVQNRFNQTFGSCQYCDINLRCRIIFIICQLGIIEKRINSVPVTDRKLVREDIKKFVRLNNTLEKIFEKFEQERG